MRHKQSAPGDKSPGALLIPLGYFAADGTAICISLTVGVDPEVGLAQRRDVSQSDAVQNRDQFMVCFRSRVRI